MVLKTKLKAWMARYGPSEILAFIGALTGGLAGDVLFHNSVVTALTATWGENSLFYGSLAIREYIAVQRKHNMSFSRTILRVLRNLTLEFSASEYLDGLIIRPSAMYLLPKITGNLALGVILGKLSADLIFYVPTIISYELRTKLLGE